MLVAKHHVGEALSPVVQKACDLAHIQSVAWSGKPELPAGARPALVISMLPSGERVIAEDLVGLMTRVQPGLPLLMLCSDELVRPTVSLQNGRVTLLGPPHTEERVAARLRILLADRRHDSSVGTLNYGIGAGDPRVFVNEQSTKRAYFAIASSRGNEPAGAETFAPVLDLADDRGMSALLTVSNVLEAELIKQAIGVVLSDDRDDEKERTLLSCVGPSGALVHLSPTNDWIFHWPDPTAGLFLVSPMRLPPVWSFASALGRTGTTFLRTAGAAGDVLVALWGVPWATADGPSAKTEAAALLEESLDGGPQVLDLLVERLKHSEAPASGLVVEVR